MKLFHHLEKKIYPLLKEHQTYILPSLNGMIFIMTNVALLLMGLIYTNNLILLIAFINASVLFTILFVTNYNLQGLKISEVVIAPQFAGDTVIAECIIENESPLERPGICIRVNDKKFITSSIKFEIKPHQRIKIPFSLPISKRGVYKICRLSLYSTYPLGLFYAWKLLKKEIEFYIFPCPLGLSLIESPLEKIEVDTDYVKKARPGSDEFQEHRQFRVGESYKSVDWKILARKKQKLTKLFGSSSSNCIKIALDKCPQENIENKLSQLSKWIMECHNEDLYWNLQISKHSIIPTNKGERHYKDCLKALATY